ncbi:MAG: 16S rRNA (uracil(1498)-N(3))-methyltransferase [Lachnospiraceae bacterium]|nr:16S rRNA (uracil(1498)-N(3))-methyltransferase [Lachnospiraceae bacterium]
MYQFFVSPEQIQGTKAYITGSDFNHIKNVLRMKIGEEIALSNGVDQKEYRVGIVAYTEDTVECELRFIKEDGMELPAEIYLFQGLPKGDKMELIIQKAVELGVHEIIPVSMNRCVVRLDEKKASSKLKRWQTIAEAAAKQSKRGIIPKIHEVLSFEQALSYADDMQVKMLPYELANGMEETKQVISSIRPGDKVAVWIGPEGGFDKQEVSKASDCGFRPISLGKRILRTETAGMTVLSILMYHMETDQEFV